MVVQLLSSDLVNDDCFLLSTCRHLTRGGKKGAYSSSWNSPQNYGTPLVNRITQYYLPPDRGDRPGHAGVNGGMIAKPCSAIRDTYYVGKYQIHQLTSLVMLMPWHRIKSPVQCLWRQICRTQQEPGSECSGSVRVRHIDGFGSVRVPYMFSPRSSSVRFFQKCGF